MDTLMFRGTFGTGCSRSAAASSYLPTLRTICRLEQLKEQDKVKRRYKHTSTDFSCFFSVNNNLQPSYTLYLSVGLSHLSK